MSLIQTSAQNNSMAVRDSDAKHQQSPKSKLNDEDESAAQVEEPQSTPQLNGQHSTNPSSSTASDGEEEETKNDSDVPPDPSAAGAVRSSNPSDDRLSNVPIAKNSTNRVKLYILCDQRTWDDKGTGHVACIQCPDDPSSWFLIVRLESNESNVLESQIQPDTVYQRQQGTLIVWSESDSCDLALSFQEKSGCAAIWDRICQIQGRDPLNAGEEDGDIDDQQSDSSNSNASSSVGSSIALPACAISNLSEIDQLIVNSMGTPSAREKMASALIAQNYLPKIIETFNMCEDVTHPNLPVFYSIAKNLFLLNSNMMLNELISDKYFKDVVGMLEYDPASPEPKKHREFLFEKSRFKEVLPIKSEELKNKIQMTYRVQYVQDVCLPAPSLFEENLLTCLTSHLFFSRAEIVNQLISDKDLMRQLFDELKSPATTSTRRRDLTQFLREFCSFVHSLQNSPAGGREQFFKTILNNDMLAAINLCISNGLPSTRNSAIEIVSMIVDYNPVFMRDYLLRQARLIPDDKPEEVLLNKIVNLITMDSDPELSMANNICTMIRNLLDSDNVVTLSAMGRTSPRSLIEKQGSSKNDKLDFFTMFYSRIIETLVRPLVDNLEDGKLKRDDYFKANQMALILELLTFCVENHVQCMRNFVIQNDLLSVVGVYLRSQHHFMALSALRVFRRVIQHRDEQYNRYITDKRILDFVVECFLANGERYNLLNSAILELFEFIRHDNIYLLLNYVVENHFEISLKHIRYTKLFDLMYARYQARENASTDVPDSFSLDPEDVPRHKAPDNEKWALEREYDADELFFNQDDEEDDEEAESPFSDAESFSTQKHAPQRKIAVEPSFPSVSKRKANSDDDGVASVFGGNLSPSISASNRISKIMIKMSDRPDTASPPPAALKEDDDAGEITVSAMQFGAGHGSVSTISPLATSSFSASNLSSSPPDDDTSPPESKRPRIGTPIVSRTATAKRAIFNLNRSHSMTDLSAADKEPREQSAELEFDKPIVLRQGMPLVDYDYGDSDDDDEEAVEDKDGKRDESKKNSAGQRSDDHSNSPKREAPVEQPPDTNPSDNNDPSSSETNGDPSAAR